MQKSQYNKYAEIARMISLKPDDHVLEIGCGWGGFAEFAAKNIGSQVTGLTISRKQYEYAASRIQKAGLNEKVKIKLCDYRDSENHQYDKIASIEMFEAVGKEYWEVFFQTLRSRLKPDGLAAMQVITIADRLFTHYSRGADYIQKYIFPGGILPTLSHLQQEIQKASLHWNKSQAFGPDYARTLKEWKKRFLKVWPELQTKGFDERFKRMWEQYLCYCEAGFLAGSINVEQISFRK